MHPAQHAGGCFSPPPPLLSPASPPRDAARLAGLAAPDAAGAAAGFATPLRGSSLVVSSHLGSPSPRESAERAALAAFIASDALGGTPGWSRPVGGLGAGGRGGGEAAAAAVAEGGAIVEETPVKGLLTAGKGATTRRRRRTCGLGLCDLLRGSRAGGAIDFGSPARGAGAPAESCALAAYQSTLGHQYLAKLAGDARAAERASAALRARERRVARDAGRWLREILPRWEERKGASRTRVLWRRGLPPSVRSAVWPLAIGNSLKMTHDLYEICVNKAQAARDDAEAARGGGGAAPGRGLGGEAFVTPAPALAPLSHSAPTFDNVPLRDGGYAEGTPITPAPLMGPSTPSVGSEPSVEAHSATSSAAMSNGMSASSGGSSAASDHGAPASRRWRPAAGLVAGAPGGSQGAFSGQWRFQPSTPPVVWTPRSFGREGSSCLIEADAARTFPELQLFRAGGALHPHLIHVLEAYVFYRPDVGYVQGMSYLAAMLLLYLEPAGAFCCLANLLNQHFFLAAFRMDDAQLRRHFNLYELMFADQLPRLYRHFDVLKLRPEAYLMSWIFTLFTKALDLEVCARVWDNYLLDGEAFVLRTALAILHCLAPRLEGAPLEACCGVLRDGPREISEDALFAAIDKFSAGSTVARNLERISSDYWQKEIPSEEPATAAYF